MLEVFKIIRQVQFIPPNGVKHEALMLVHNRAMTIRFSITYEAAGVFFTQEETKIYVLAEYFDGKLHIQQKLIDQNW